MYGKSPARLVPLLLGLQLTALWPTTAVEIYTSGAVEAMNGTDTRLKCTFSSFAPVGDALTVTWNFRPRDGGPEQFVFYYHVDPFPPMSGRFKDRVVWDGNPERYDVSILLWKLQFDDNGTYTCQVKNPPDVDGLVGTVRLSVVHTVQFSEIYFLALAIGSACALMSSQSGGDKIKRRRKAQPRKGLCLFRRHRLTFLDGNKIFKNKNPRYMKLMEVNGNLSLAFPVVTCFPPIMQHIPIQHLLQATQDSS
ncbi:myelin protein zero protein 2-like [Marmota monax]|uniref:Myelin protein zero protein 2-like n=1 Tax=Marmota monax TaxID=9995 RepID=A0A834QZJ7_MARMO|nr:myelin protein zero protein 2-like [Marmota monax]